MTGKIQIVKLDDVEATPEDDGLLMERNILNESHGSKRFDFVHANCLDGLDLKDVEYDGQDELVYVVQGECEIKFDGQAHRVGAGGTIFVPANTLYDFKTTKTPLEVIAVFSPGGGH